MVMILPISTPSPDDHVTGEAYGLEIVKHCGRLIEHVQMIFGNLEGVAAGDGRHGHSFACRS
jgi:hypothetical protein